MIDVNALQLPAFCAGLNVPQYWVDRRAMHLRGKRTGYESGQLFKCFVFHEASPAAQHSFLNEKNILEFLRAPPAEATPEFFRGLAAAVVEKNAELARRCAAYGELHKDDYKMLLNDDITFKREQNMLVMTECADYESVFKTYFNFVTGILREGLSRKDEPVGSSKWISTGRIDETDPRYACARAFFIADGGTVNERAIQRQRRGAVLKPAQGKTP